MTGLAGAVAWAVVPFAPEAPFRIYAGPAREPFTVDTPHKLIAAAKRGGDPQLTYLVPGKVRPVLILSDAYDDEGQELLALHLARFSKLSADEQQRVRDEQHPTLLHLRPSRFPTLPEENAVLIPALVRVHRSAVDGDVLGRLDAYELTTVHERLIRFHGFNVRKLVEERLAKLAEAQRR